MSKLTHMMLREALKDVSQNGKTARSYIKVIKRNFGPWAAENGIRLLKEVDVETVQEYADYLREKGYSPSTIHTYIAPICKAIRINMKEIEKPRRESGAITRGRGGEVGKRGQADAEKKENERIVNAAKAIGIRRDEYRRLLGSDLVRGDDGFLYVHVDKGKGGKEHFQRILPQHNDTVLSLFKNIRPGQHVFTREEMLRSKAINLHGYRAEAAKEAYAYYSGRLEAEPDYCEKLKEDLINRFLESNIGVRKAYKDDSFSCPENKKSPAEGRASFNKALNAFKREMNYIGKYSVRGDNRRRCIEKGIPTEYDRVALLAVSVFHLSHWRNDVTVTNYITA